ncbi:acyl carrier protein [Thermodesulfobacteriota bacterium]
MTDLGKESMEKDTAAQNYGSAPDSIESKVIDLIAEVLVDVNKENIHLESKIVEDLGAESLDIYDMIALLEDEFGVEVTDEEVEKIQSVQDVASFIKEADKAS